LKQNIQTDLNKEENKEYLDQLEDILEKSTSKK
jgi:hypothetical protein